MWLLLGCDSICEPQLRASDDGHQPRRRPRRDRHGLRLDGRKNAQSGAETEDWTRAGRTEGRARAGRKGLGLAEGGSDWRASRTLCTGDKGTRSGGGGEQNRV